MSRQWGGAIRRVTSGCDEEKVKVHMRTRILSAHRFLQIKCANDTRWKIIIQIKLFVLQ